MLALITFLLGVAEVDPNLIIAAMAGASGPTVAAILGSRGTRAAVDRLEQKVDSQSQRIDDVFSVVAAVPRATNTKVVQAPTGETVVTVTPHEDMATLAAQIEAQRKR